MRPIALHNALLINAWEKVCNDSETRNNLIRHFFTAHLVLVLAHLNMKAPMKRRSDVVDLTLKAHEAVRDSSWTRDSLVRHILTHHLPIALKFLNLATPVDAMDENSQVTVKYNPPEYSWSHKIPVIKVMREHLGLGLAEAKGMSEGVVTSCTLSQARNLIEGLKAIPNNEGRISVRDVNDKEMFTN